MKKGKSVEIPVISVISVCISALWADRSVLCEIWGGSRDTCHAAQLSISPASTASMHKHHHCCKCPECYEVTRMAALRRMDAPSYGGDWQAEPYGYPPGYGGGQTLPPPASGGGGSMGGGGGTLGRSKGKIMSGGGPGGPNPKGQSKGGPKVNGNNSSGQGGWWPECTCTNREWYDQVSHRPRRYTAPAW